MLGSCGGVQVKRSAGASKPVAPWTVPTSTLKFWIVDSSDGLTGGVEGMTIGPGWIAAVL